MKKILILVFGFFGFLTTLVKGQSGDLIAPILEFAKSQPEDIAIIGLNINQVYGQHHPQLERATTDAARQQPQNPRARRLRARHRQQDS